MRVVPDGVNPETLRRGNFPFQIVAHYPGLMRFDSSADIA